jgi:hypothetical protein
MKTDLHIAEQDELDASALISNEAGLKVVLEGLFERVLTTLFGRAGLELR